MRRLNDNRLDMGGGFFFWKERRLLVAWACFWAGGAKHMPILFLFMTKGLVACLCAPCRRGVLARNPS